MGASWRWSLAAALGLSMYHSVYEAEAAPAATQLAAEILVADTTSYNTTAFALSANSLVTFTITGALAAGTGISTPTITCHGATWETVASLEAGSPARKVFVFGTIVGTSSASTTCAYDFGQTQVRSSYTIQEWIGGDISSVAGAIVQSTTASGGGTPCTVTLAAYGSADNRAFLTCREGAAETHTPESGWTELSDPTPTESMTHSAIWSTTSADTTPSITFASGTALWIGVGLEVAATGTAGTGCRSAILRLGAGC